MADMQRTWPPGFQSLSGPSPPVSPVSQVIPPLIAATPPRTIAMPRHNSGSRSASAGSWMQRPRSVPAAVSPRQPYYVASGTSSPTNRKGSLTTYPGRDISPAGIGASTSSSYPKTGWPLLSAVHSASNGSISGSGSSPIARPENAYHFSWRDESGLRERPMITRAVTPPLNQRTGETAELNKTPTRSHASSHVLLSKPSSVSLLGPYAAGVRGIHSTPAPVSSTAPPHALAEREGKNFAAATKLLIRTEQQLATALSEAEALKEAERHIGAELSEANASSKAEERLLSEISDAQNQLKAGQAKFVHELQEARGHEERAEATLATEMAELQRARDAMERYEKDAARQDGDSQEKTSQTTARLAQLEAELTKAQKVPGMMQTAHDHALEEKNRELAAQNQFASECLAKLHEQANDQAKMERRHAEQVASARADVEQAHALELVNVRAEVEQARAAALELANVRAEVAQARAAAQEVPQATPWADERAEMERRHALELANARAGVEQQARTAWATERAELERIHALELANARAEVEQARAAVRELPLAAPTTPEDVTDHAAMEESLREAAARVECLTRERDQALAAAAQVTQELDVERDSVAKLFSELAFIKQELTTTQETLRSAEAAQESERIAKSSVEVRYNALAKRNAELEGSLEGAQEAAQQIAEQAVAVAVPIQSRQLPCEQTEVEQLRLELADARNTVHSLRAASSSSLAAKQAELDEARRSLQTLQSDASSPQGAQDADLAAGHGEESCESYKTYRVARSAQVCELDDVDEGLEVSEDLIGPPLQGKTPADVFYELHMSCEDYILRQMQAGLFVAEYEFSDDEECAPSADGHSLPTSKRPSVAESTSKRSSVAEPTSKRPSVAERSVGNGVNGQYLVDNSELNWATSGLHYRLEKRVDDRSLASEEKAIVRWGTIIQGTDRGDGWLECQGGLFLPFSLDGARVLFKVDTEVSKNLYFIDNSKLQASTDGLGYRTSRNMDSKRIPEGWEAVAFWGAAVRGVEEGDWLRVGPFFLPMHVEGIPVVVKA